MTLKRFLAVLLIVAGCFIAGVLVGRFVMPREVHITVVDIRQLVEVIEKYNELKCELEKIKILNKDAITESAPREEKKGKW